MTLPTPSPEALALSNTLLSQIIDEIKTQGAISFARYMQLALYAPGLGYYQNGYQKFGKEGDFVTAPELSPLFSCCLANQCAEILAKVNGGDILEFGAGSGVMAADILCHLYKINQLPAHYFIMEVSASLKAQQYETIQQKVPAYIDQVVWLTSLPEKPITGVILANEVLDAMPVALVAVNDSDEALALIEKDDISDAAVSVTVDDAGALALTGKQGGYLTEMHPMVAPWVSSVSRVLAQGAVIVIDYGFLAHEYYHPDRSMGTLMCHYRHYAHPNPFLYPGLQDITAHVNFTLLAESAEKNGFSVTFMNQAQFLLENHLLSLMEKGLDEKAQIIQNRQIVKLTSPNEMGELFKVMILSKP